MKNPFVVLGLHPDVVAKEKPAVLDELIAATYRVLQRYYHPDSGQSKSESKTRELSEAREALDRTKYPREFAELKEKYIKKSPAKIEIADLKSQLEAQKKLAESRSKSMINYLRCLYVGSDDPCVFNLVDIEMRLSNVAKNMNEGMRNILAPKRFVDGRYHIKADANGKLFVKEGKEYEAFPEKVFLVGCVPESLKDQLMQAIRDITRRKNEEKLISFNVSAGFQYFENYYTEAEMQSIASLFSPMITKKSYLFSMLVKNNGDLYFKLEGQVLEINPTSK